jgi:hypothetical protein
MLIFAGLAIGAPVIGGLFDLTTVTAGLGSAAERCWGSSRGGFSASLSGGVTARALA